MDGNYLSLEQCIAGGLHLESCDSDGYCDYCGEQDEVPSKRVKLRLTLDITYDLNGVDDGVMRENMKDIANRAAGDGLMTGETAATVDEWTAKVEKIS